MKVRVLLFAALAERVGLREIALDLPAGSRVGDALDQLQRLHPDLAAARPTLAFAVNLAYIDARHELEDADELALISPVSGG